VAGPLGSWFHDRQDPFWAPSGRRSSSRTQFLVRVILRRLYGPRRRTSLRGAVRRCGAGGLSDGQGELLVGAPAQVQIWRRAALAVDLSTTSRHLPDAGFTRCRRCPSATSARRCVAVVQLRLGPVGRAGRP